MMLDYSTESWENYYREIHGLIVDFSEAVLPIPTETDRYLICRPEQFFAEQAYSGGKRMYPKRKFTDRSLDDVAMMGYGRDGRTEAYAIAVDGDNVKGLCLTERMILNDFFFWKYKKHLLLSREQCLNSRVMYGCVPLVGIYWGKMFLGLDTPGECGGFFWLMSRSQPL